MVLTLAASACSTPPQGPPVVKVEYLSPSPPPAALKRCDDPQRLPPRGLTAAEVTTFWGRDRAALEICESRRAAAVEGYRARPAQ